MTISDKPLTSKEREALGEYIIRQQKMGRGSLPLTEIIIASEAIRVALSVFTPNETGREM